MSDKIYGRAVDNYRIKTDVTQFIELNGVTYCKAHFDNKFHGGLWNEIFVNNPTWGEAFAAKLVYWIDNNEVVHCDICKAQLHVPDSDAKDWTQAWVEVGLKIGFEVVSQSFLLDETELRHQCYIILGRYHIKASYYKSHVRVLIQLAQEMNKQRLEGNK